MNSWSLAMNAVGDMRRLFKNKSRILTISLNCSSLIDVLKCGYYNIDMDENAVINLVAIEKAEPKRRIIRSVGAIYLALIVLVIGCISVGNLLYDRFQIPRHVTQPILYALIAICGYYIYRRHYLCYRYTLTDEMLAIERIGGNSERTLAAIDLNKIISIDGNKNQKSGKNRVYASLLSPKDTTWILALVDGKELSCAIGASKEFVSKMVEQKNDMAKKKDVD